MRLLANPRQPCTWLIAVVSGCLLCASFCFAEPESAPRKTKSARSKTPRTTVTMETHAQGDNSTNSQAFLAKGRSVNQAAAIEESMTSLVNVADSRVRVGYRIREASAWYEFKGGTLSWREPLASETHFLQVSVQDAADRRVFPGCKVIAGIADAKGKEIVTSTTLTFLWDPDFYFYGANVAIPGGAKDVSLNIRVDPPEFGRTGKTAGAFFVHPVSYSWKIAEIATSAKPKALEKKQTESIEFGKGRHPVVSPTPYPGSGTTSALSLKTP